MTAIEYAGTLDVDPTRIDTDNDPWVEVDGEPVNWTLTPVPFPVNHDCENACNGGILAPMNTAVGVERCDACGVFEDDLDAVLALARAVKGTAWLKLVDDD